MKKNTFNRIVNGVSAIIVTLVLTLFLLPTVWTFFTSIKPARLVASIPPAIIFTPTLEHYLQAFRSANFLRIFFNTVIVAGGTTIVVTIFGSLAAYGFVRFVTRANTPLLYFFMISRMIPSVATLMPLFIFMIKFRLLDTPIALILADSAFYLSFVIWLLRSFFLTIPIELEEAALIDGATRLQTLFKIFLPLAAPGMVVGMIFTFNFAWNELMYSLTFSSIKSQTLPVLAAQYQTLAEGIQWGAMTAAAMIIMMPVLVFALIVQRFMISGLTMGGVKE